MASSSYSYSYSDSEDDLGSGGYLDSEEEEEVEGSSWDEKEFSVKVVEVEGGADLVGGWAPGGLHQACAVALREEEKRAVFIVTGGRLTSSGGGVGKCHKGIVQMEGKSRARVGEGQDCGNLVHPRRQHGCTPLHLLLQCHCSHIPSLACCSSHGNLGSPAPCLCVH